MVYFRKRWGLILLLALLGCTTPADEPPAEVSDLSLNSVDAEVEPTAVPTTAPTAIPTATEQAEVATPTAEVVEVVPTATAEVIEVAVAEPVFFGRTEEGALFRGAADAPLTLIDYSDFL